MPKHGTTRHGSLQFYPRVRAKKILPRVSWKALNREDVNLLGFIGYKVGMKSAFVKNSTPNSLTKGQRVTIPVTIIECPTMKIFSVRFYKDGKVIGCVLNQNIDKEMKKKVKMPKVFNKKIEDFTPAGVPVEGKDGDYDDIRLIVYSQVKKTGIKKKPDMAEIGVSGKLDEKLEFVKNNLNKEISIRDVFSEGVVDVRGVTIGKGNQGSMKRFGLELRFHKSEKGQRGPGSGGPWHPARVEYTQPMSGQMGFFTRTTFNHKILLMGNVSDLDINIKSGFRHFGKIKGDYIVLCGSVQGPKKRQVLITNALRPTVGQVKKKYEFMELR
ncbi:50S ribosomal protein L3 [archaeon]|jgi:large subunit ribosomal protein L3|nr:50S ribosomal protein L3 [archaeon]